MIRHETFEPAEPVTGQHRAIPAVKLTGQPDKTQAKPAPSSHPADLPLADRIRDEITFHVGRLLALIEQREGEVPPGSWWDLAIALSEHTDDDPATQHTADDHDPAATAATTATIEIGDEAVYPTSTLGHYPPTSRQDASQAPQEAPPVSVEIDLAPVWRVVWALTACAITIVALLVLAYAWSIR